MQADNFDAVYEVSKRDSVKMESELYPRHDSEPDLYRTQANLQKGSTQVSKEFPEVSTKLKPRNKSGRNRDVDGSLYSAKHTLSSSHESQDRRNVGLDIFTQGTRSEDRFDEFIKPNGTADAFVWDKVYTRDLINKETDPQDFADRYIKENEVNAFMVHDTGLDKPGESTELLVLGGTQGLDECEDVVVENEVAQGFTLTDRRETSTERGVLLWGEEQAGLSSKGSCGNVSEETLTDGDNLELAASTQGPANLPAIATVHHTRDKELKNEVSPIGDDEDDFLKLSGEAKMEDEKGVLNFLKGSRESSSEKERDPVWEKLARIENMSNSQTVLAGNHLGNMKFAVANLMSEVMNSYENACRTKVERTLLLTKPTLHFLETQEIKKTFYLKEITSAMAELAEAALTEEDSHEYRKLRETAQTLYDLQTREMYYEQNSSEPTEDAQFHGNPKTFTCFFFVAVVAAGIVLGLNGEWMALILLVLMILSCVFFAFRGAAKSVQRRKRKLRAKML